ncbi:MAG: hypothetical protein AAB534_02550 [Patescibacteria group bacterium]
MPKFFRARKAEIIKKFLETKDFYLANTNGDDEIWARRGFNYTLKLPNRNEEIPDGTMSSIKKCMRHCGVDPKEMLEWWKKEGYGD